jgi:hypothetical protein
MDRAMTNDEIRGHLARVAPEFGSAAALFAEALSAEHAKVDVTRPVPAKELAEIYAGRRDGMRSRGASMEGLDALVVALQSRGGVNWTMVGVSGGACWGALFVPDDGLATACIAKRST